MELAVEDLGVVSLLQSGSLVGSEGDHHQLIAGVERLVANGLQGVGSHDLTDGRARKGHVGDANGAVSHGDGGGIARVGDQLQTGGYHTVQVAVNDTDGVADGIGQRLGHVVHTIEGIGHGGGEGLQAAVCEGVVTQIRQSRAKSHGEIRHLGLQERVRTDIGSGGQVSRGDGGVSQGVVAHKGDAVQILHADELGAVGEYALLQGHTVGVELDGGQTLVVDEGVGAHGLHGGQIHGGQGGAVEGIGTDGGNARKVEARQSLAVEEGLSGDGGDAVAQLDGGQVVTMGKGRLTDGGSGGQIHGGDVGGVVQVDVPTLLIHGGDGQTAVGEEVQHVSREGGLTHRGHGRQVDARQGRAVVEGEVANGHTLTQSHALQLGRAVEGGATQGDVVTDGEGGQGGGQHVVVEAGIVFLIEGSLKIAVDVQTEGTVTDDGVASDPHAAQGLALTERGVPYGHARGNDYGLHSGAGKGEVTDDRHARQVGGGLQSGAEEAVIADDGETTEGHGLKARAIREGVGLHDGDLGHLHRGQLLVTREGTHTDGGHPAVGQLEASLHPGSNQHQRISYII